MNKKTKGVGIWLSMFLLLMLMAVLLFSSMKQPASTEKYSDVLGYFQRLEVQSFVFDLGTGDLEMTFTDGKTKAYRVPNVNLFINDVYAERYDGSDNYIQQYNKANPDAPMQYDLLPIKTTPWWVSLIPTLVLVGLLVFFYFMMMKQARGMAGGYTLSLPGEDKTYVTKREMNEDIVTLLGGRVAEKLVLDDISTGASNDIERATKVARNMVVRYGFSEKLGPIVYGHDDNEVFLGRDFSSTPSYSETVAAEIDAEIREIIDTAYERAVDILTEHMGQLHEIAKYLFENEKMDEKTFADMMAGKNTVNLEKSADSTEQDSAQTAVSVEEAADEAGQDPTV